jgi:hypothetical protein
LKDRLSPLNRSAGKLRKRGKLLVVPKQAVAADAVQAVRQTRKDRL